MQKRIFWSIAGTVVLAATFGWWGWANRYRMQSEMTVPIASIATEDYPGDPARHSSFYNQYTHRQLTLTKREGNRYDFTFHSLDPHVATITLNDIDLGLFIPLSPSWIKNRELEAITITEREWNRQQVLFSADSSRVVIQGGDGFEARHVHALELIRNCLNAGLWEIELYTNEEGNSALFYHGWFTLPLGIYKQVFESINQCSYWRHFWRLEHWVDPQGVAVHLDRLRIMTSQREVHARFDPTETLSPQGEQKQKDHLVWRRQTFCWRDLSVEGDRIHFPTFAPPGRYCLHRPWYNEFSRVSRLRGALVRRVLPVGSFPEVDEIELVFESPNSLVTRLLVSGIDLATLPVINPKDYHLGWNMPLGIAVPPIEQTYDDLQAHPPTCDPYFGLLIDDEYRWLNHRAIAIDGVVLLRDQSKASDLHVYLLSYERFCLVGHYVLELEDTTSLN